MSVQTAGCWLILSEVLVKFVNLSNTMTLYIGLGFRSLVCQEIAQIAQVNHSVWAY